VPVMSSTVFKQQLQSTPLQGANASFIEALYESYLESPASVPEVWRRFFESVGSEHDEVAHGPIREALGRRLAAQPGAAAARVAAPPPAPGGPPPAAPPPRPPRPPPRRPPRRPAPPRAPRPPPPPAPRPPPPRPPPPGPLPPR